MNGLVRKLVISVLSISFSIVVFGTATYAWITLTTTNTADGLTLNISAGDELQFSIDGINYYNRLPSDVIMEKIPDLSFKDITSMDGINFKTGGPQGTDIAVKNVDYFSLTFWVRTTGLEHYVYLVENVNNLVTYDIGRDGTYVVSRGVNWRSDQTFLYGPANEVIRSGENRVFYASQAIRISFIEDKDINNIYDIRELSELNKFIYSPSEDPQRGYGMSYGAVDYYNQKKGTNILPPFEKPDTVYTLTKFASNNPYIPLNDDSKVMRLIETDITNEKNQTYFVGKVTINVWLEGWDADCFDAIYKDTIKIQLKFRVGKQIKI